MTCAILLLSEESLMPQHGPWVRASLPRLTLPKQELDPSRKRGRAQHREEGHKAAISEAIRRKWADPAYRERVLKAKALHSETSGKVCFFKKILISEAGAGQAPTSNII